MKWSDDYATGVPQIDEQHRMIFQLADGFRAALDEGRGERVYGELLASLEQYVRVHFGHEESCMARFVCPAAQANQEAHAGFISLLGDFRIRYTSNGFDRADARRLVDTIDRWLVDHICRIDVQLKPFVVSP